MDAACPAPSTFLKNHLAQSNIAGVIDNNQVDMDWDDANPYLLIVTYSFEAPEKSIRQEKRITELNHFSSQCYDLQ